MSQLTRFTLDCKDRVWDHENPGGKPKYQKVVHGIVANTIVRITISPAPYLGTHLVIESSSGHWIDTFTKDPRLQDLINWWEAQSNRE